MAHTQAASVAARTDDDDAVIKTLVGLVETGPLSLGAFTTAQILAVNGTAPGMPAPEPAVLAEAVRGLVARGMAVPVDGSDEIDVRGDLGLLLTLQRRSRLLVDVVFRGRGEQRPWHLALVPQPEGVTLWGTIDPLGLHHLTLYQTADAVARLQQELPQGRVEVDNADGEVEERIEGAKESALVSVVRFSDSAPVSSDDLVIIDTGDQIEVLRRASREEPWLPTGVAETGLMGLIREMAPPSAGLNGRRRADSVALGAPSPVVVPSTDLPVATVPNHPRWSPPPGRHTGGHMSDSGTQGGGMTRLLPTTRLEAFSDGVFAIAITLLVLELHVPTDPHELLRELGAEWASYLGYFVSFWFVGGVSMAHSNLTRFIKAADQVMMGLNLVLLLFVSFLPFTTSLLANHLDDSAAHIAVVIFGINLTLASLMVNVMFGYASRTEGVAASDAADAELKAFDRQRRVAVVIQAVATLIGLILPVAAVVVYLVISLLVLVDPIWRAEHARRAARRGGGMSRDALLAAACRPGAPKRREP